MKANQEVFLSAIYLKYIPFHLSFVLLMPEQMTLMKTLVNAIVGYAFQKSLYQTIISFDYSVPARKKIKGLSNGFLTIKRYNSVFFGNMQVQQPYIKM